MHVLCLHGCGPGFVLHDLLTTPAISSNAGALQIRLNFAIEDAGIFSQLAHLADLLERLDPTLYFKLRQVGNLSCVVACCAWLGFSAIKWW